MNLKPLAPYAATAAGAALTSAAYLGRAATAKQVAGFTALVMITDVAAKAIQAFVQNGRVSPKLTTVSKEKNWTNAATLATPAAVNYGVNKAAAYVPAFASSMLGRDWKTVVVGYLVAKNAATFISDLTNKAATWLNAPKAKASKPTDGTAS